MNVVVDASVVVKWLFQEPYSDRAETLLVDADRKRVKLSAPDILPTEIANALWKRKHRGDLDRPTTLRAADYFESICPLLYPSVGLWKPALNFAIGYDHPVYDCLYLALAEELLSELVTADEKFYRAFAKDFPRLRLLQTWI